MEFRKMVMITLYAEQKKRHEARVGCSERIALKQVYYQG